MRVEREYSQLQNFETKDFLVVVVERMIKPCWKPSVEGDGLLWYKELGHHVHGEFSMATIQANSLMEDQSQLESGPLSWTDSGPQGTFVGVYDGHGGTEASRFVNDKLFCNLKSMLSSLMHGYIFNFIKDLVSIIVSNGSVCTNN